MPPTSWIRIDFSIAVLEWPGDYPEEGGKGHEMREIRWWEIQSILSIYVSCGHVWDNNNNKVDNNNKKKDGEDESVSAHLPAGTPTGCV